MDGAVEGDGTFAVGQMDVENSLSSDHSERRASTLIAHIIGCCGENDVRSHVVSFIISQDKLFVEELSE